MQIFLLTKLIYKLQNSSVRKSDSIFFLVLGKRNNFSDLCNLFKVEITIFNANFCLFLLQNIFI